MAELVGTDSQVGWAGTFLAILLPGAMTGGLLGWAEVLRRAQRVPRWLVLAPLPFAVVPLLIPGALRALLTQGLGGGAVAIALFAMFGGYALSGRGSRVARSAIGALAAMVVIGLAAAGPIVGGASHALTEPRGAWVAVLACSLLMVLAIASSIPFRGLPQRPGEGSATSVRGEINAA
jgi:hypothetical protein